MIHQQAQREIDRIQERLDETDDPEERRALIADMREIEREMADHERWLEDGNERGWT